MDNATRRQLLQRHRQSGFPGSIIDVYKAYDQGIDLIGQFEQQQQLQKPSVASTPQEQQAGLRPAHQAGNVNQSMAFPNVPPNASFNTVGMKAPIDIKQFSPQGNLVRSFDAVPPGVTDLKMGSEGGMVLETPAQMQSGGVRKYQLAGPKIDGPRVPALSDAQMSLKILQEANAGNPAARRMRSDYGQRMFLPGETNPSTHYMASFDNYAVPTVQEDYIGGPLSYNSNPAPSKADFRFNAPEQAAYFAKNYKQASAAKAFQQKNGGVRKAQSGLPPFSLEQQPIQSESTFRPNYGEQAFLNQMAAGPREERVLNIGPTISQGNFEVDENNKIIEDRPSYLEMAANPMATARAILNPAVEGLPSQVEFDQSVGRGNTLGVMANDVVNPAAWANYGIDAARNFGQAANYAVQGEGQKAFQAFGSGAMNALSAVPGMALSGSATAAAGKQALNATVGQGIRNVAYNMVDPFGYTPKFLTPRQIIRNVRNPAGRPTFHRGFENAKYPDAASGAARRLDALAIGLGKKPRYNTFRQIGDNTYEPINGAADVQDILRTTENVLNRRLASTGELGERGSTIGLNDGTFKTMGGYHLVDEAVPNNPMLRRMIMNDTWDLHPFKDLGVEHFANSYPATKKIWNALPTRAQNYVSNKFRDLEVFDALGGKPINIQSRWTAHMAEDWATNKNVGDIILTNDATGRSFNSYALNNSPQDYQMLSLFDKPNYKTGGVKKYQRGNPPKQAVAGATPTALELAAADQMAVMANPEMLGDTYLNETDPRASYYIDNELMDLRSRPWFTSQSTGNGPAWSAGTVSNLMRAQYPDFPDTVAHADYVNNVIEGKNGADLNARRTALQRNFNEGSVLVRGRKRLKDSNFRTIKNETTGQLYQDNKTSGIPLHGDVIIGVVTDEKGKKRYQVQGGNISDSLFVEELSEKEIKRKYPMVLEQRFGGRRTPTKLKDRRKNLYRK